MSQAGQVSVEASPTVADQFNTDFKTVGTTVSASGAAIPSANQLNIFARDTNQDNANGIRTNADQNNQNNLYVELTNRVQGSGSTVGGLQADINLIDFSAAPFSGTPGVYTFDIKVAGFASLLPAGCVYNLFGGIRTNGTTPTIIDVFDKFVREETAVISADAELAVSGNILVLRVTGVMGLNISWDVVGSYTRSI